MGGAAAEPAKGGKRSMDANINLVPYIDLLMTIMTFLVMTAVWTQLATLEVQNSSGGPQDEKEEKDEDKPKPIIVLIADGKITVQEEGTEATEYLSTADGYDFEGPKTQLTALKAARPERVVVQIKAEDGVEYEHIVKMIDVSTGIELTGITLQPASQ